MREDLAAVAYRRLDDLISGPEWSRGGRLPSEVRLSQAIGVSRPVLRRALAELRREGRITSSRGSGSFVRPRSETTPAAGDRMIRNLGDLEQCMRFRMVLESGIAGEIARKAAQVDIAAVERANDALAAGLPDGSLFEADFAFHLRLAELTGNPFFVRALLDLKPQVRVAYELSRQFRAVPLNETSYRVIREHEGVLAAIRAGNGAGAEAAMRAHIGAGIGRLFGNAK
ncbi:FadR/GntR family transcriptional regulator [Tropicimonas sp.]|uniref:FadR/GntR family transcriptional regulator n=1 Tax=Tropicimonas sp. TaxID=2067044 RepID=UPI003A8BE2C2